MERCSSIGRIAVAFGIGILFAAAPAQNATFTLHKVMDSGDSRHVAMTYLIPKGWKGDDSLNWSVARRTAPLEYTVAASSPDKRFNIQYLNAIVFNYSHTPDKGYQGKNPPPQPTDVVIGAFKSGHPGVAFEIVDRQETPTTSVFKSSGVNITNALKCSVKLRFTANGVSMLWKTGFDYDSYQSGTPWGLAHGYVDGYWQLTNLTSISGPEAEFSKAMKLAGVTLSSRRFDPQFFQQYLEIVQMILNEFQRENQERIDAQLQQLRARWHDLDTRGRAAFDAQEANKDRFTRDMCDFALDQERYTDGSTQFIMPSGYNRAITNGDEYILTNDRNFSPGGNWHDLQKVGL